jgi:hypothetical protein
MFVGKGRKSSIFRPLQNRSVEPFPADQPFREHLFGDEAKGAFGHRLEPPMKRTTVED